MDSLQIKNILSRDSVTKRYFLDVFPSDQLPTVVGHYPACFVCNVDKSSAPGTHWLAMYLAAPDKVEFFDSYGSEPTFFKGPISNFVSHFSHMTFNPVVLQSNVTAVCGQYCIYYLYCRCRGKSLKTIVSQFTTQNMCNDQSVYNFVAKKFGVYANFFQ